MPSAESKEMVIVGPAAIQSRASSPPPTITARIGISQIQEKRCSLRGRTSGRGRVSSGVADTPCSSFGCCSLLFISKFRWGARPSIPTCARVITHGSQHGENDNHAEASRRGTGNYLRYARKISHCRHEYHHKNVQHGPLADKLDELV